MVVSVVDDDFIEDEEAFDIILTVPPADVGSVIFNGTDVTTFTIIQDPNDSKLYTVMFMTSPTHLFSMLSAIQTVSLASHPIINNILILGQ